MLPQGDYCIHVPGAKRRKYLQEDVAALSMSLSPAELGALQAFFPRAATCQALPCEVVMALLDI